MAPRVPLAVLPLPSGETLTIREPSLADEDAVARLYAGLSPDDRHKRFFSAHDVVGEELERWVRPEEQHGFRILAVADDGELIGDAAFFLLDDGSNDAELELTIAAGHRGWLGPYLLEVLVEQARQHQVRNLRAVVLCQNRQMLGVLRSRGIVGLVQDDPALVAVEISTTDDVPTWSTVDRPRLLVEGASAEWHAAAAIQDAGYEVLVCPMVSSLLRAHCPAQHGRPCRLAEGADVIVAVHADTEPGAQLVEHHRHLPSPPLLVTGPGHGVEGAVEVPLGADPDEIVDRIERERAARSNRPAGATTGS
jgi:hypothetical protein